MNKTIIEIDVTPEADRYLAAEPDLSTPEKMLTFAKASKAKPYTMGQHLIIAKHRGETFDEVPEHKPGMMMGYAAWYSRHVASLKEQVELKNGQTVNVRSQVFPVVEQAVDDDGQLDTDVEIEDDPAPVSWDTAQAVERATRYLLERVPGYIIGRMNIIAANDGDVWAVWRELVEKVEGRLAGMT